MESIYKFNDVNILEQMEILCMIMCRYTCKIFACIQSHALSNIYIYIYIHTHTHLLHTHVCYIQSSVATYSFVRMLLKAT
jgi:hypothetical protein